MIQMRIDLRPIAAPRPRVTRWGTFYDSKYVVFKRKIMAKAQEAMRGKERYECPLYVVIQFRFRPPSSWSEKRKREAIEWGWMAQKPDVDNAIKGVLDSCNGIIWKDDKQVASISAFKRYAKQDGIDVFVGPHAECIKPATLVAGLTKAHINWAEAKNEN